MFRLDLDEYKQPARRLSELLPWALLVSPSVLQHKTGALMSVIRYRGQDLDSVTSDWLDVLTLRLNEALKGLGGGFALHVEAHRRPMRAPKALRIEHPVPRLIEEIRRTNMLSLGVLFETDY